MAEQGVEVDHSTINRWVLKFAPELDKRLPPHLSLTNDSWRVDETYIEIKGSGNTCTERWIGRATRRTSG
jgi:transposase-like protein